MLAAYFAQNNADRTALLHARHDQALRVLVDAGAHLENDAPAAYTLLMRAAMQGHQNVVRLLLRAGADAGVRVAGGMTAAELAQKHNQSGLLPMLRCAENLRPGEAFGKHCE